MPLPLTLQKFVNQKQRAGTAPQNRPDMPQGQVPEIHGSGDVHTRENAPMAAKDEPMDEL